MDDIYYNSSVILLRKTPYKIISWITILFISMLSIIIFGIVFKYNKYEKYIAIFKDNQLHLLIEPNRINDLKTEFILNNKKYSFEINSISEDYIINETKNYYEVILNCELDNKYKINNNILNINMELDKTTLLKEILNFLKKGLM